MSFENNLLDVWFGGSHHPDRREHVGVATPNASRDQVLAVVQALQWQQSEATGPSPTAAEPVNDLARAFLLSSPEQKAGIPPSPTPKAAIPSSVTPSARIPPSATQNARTRPNPTQNTANPPSSKQDAGIKDPSRLPANDSLIKSRFASTVLRVARSSDGETAARLVRAISRDFPLDSEIPQIAEIHRRAIASFDQLATGLAAAPNPRQQLLWKAALEAAAAWLRAVQPKGDNVAA